MSPVRRRRHRAGAKARWRRACALSGVITAHVDDAAPALVFSFLIDDASAKRERVRAVLDALGVVLASLSAVDA